MTDLHAAYHTTIFAVHAPAHRLTIRIGEHHPAVDQLAANMLGIGHTTWCHITAHNPRSEMLTEAENEHRTRALERDLRALRAMAEARGERGPVWLPGDGRSPDGQWVEAGMWVAGLDRLSAWVLGARYQQNAVVWGETGGPAQLFWVCGPSGADGCTMDASLTAVHGTGAALMAALETLHADLSARRGPEPSTLQQLSQPWLRVVQAEQDVLWCQPRAAGRADDALSGLPSLLEEFDRPTPSRSLHAH